MVTDFVSYYSLPSTVVRHPEHKLLRAAYSYYTVGTTASVKDLIADALVLAYKVTCLPLCNLISNSPLRTPHPLLV